jgi:hypothetical protein
VKGIYYVILRFLRDRTTAINFPSQPSVIFSPFRPSPYFRVVPINLFEIKQYGNAKNGKLEKKCQGDLYHASKVICDTLILIKFFTHNIYEYPFHLHIHFDGNFFSLLIADVDQIDDTTTPLLIHTHLTAFPPQLRLGPCFLYVPKNKKQKKTRATSKNLIKNRRQTKAN